MPFPQEPVCLKFCSGHNIQTKYHNMKNMANSKYEIIFSTMSKRMKYDFTSACMWMPGTILYYQSASYLSDTVWEMQHSRSRRRGNRLFVSMGGWRDENNVEITRSARCSNVLMAFDDAMVKAMCCQRDGNPEMSRGWYHMSRILLDTLESKDT